MTVEKRKMTRKACQGCGRTESYLFRYADEVCNECKSLLREAIENRERIKTQKDKVSIRLGDPYYLNSGFYGCYYDLDSGIRRELDKSFHSVILSIGEKAHDRLFEREAKRVYSEKSDDANYLMLLVTLEQQQNLLNLNAHIRQALESAYTLGVKKGSDMLRGLALGEAGINDFEIDTFRVLSDNEKEMLKYLPSDEFGLHDLPQRLRWISEKDLDKLCIKGFMKKRYDVEKEALQYKKKKEDLQ